MHEEYGPIGKYNHSGDKGPSEDKFWQLTGYPRWHQRSKKFPQKRVLKEGFLSIKN